MQEGRAKAGEGFDRASFVVDWDAHTVTCPAGKQNYSWLPYDDPDKALAQGVRVQFASRDCTPCPLRSHCTKRKSAPRELLLQRREEYEALQMAKQRQTTEAFQEEYALRAGVEATHAEAASAERLAPHEVHWARENAPATYFNRSRSQLGASSGVADGNFTDGNGGDQDASIAFCCSRGRCGMKSASSTEFGNRVNVCIGPRCLLQDLPNLGVGQIDLIVTDGHDGLLAAVVSLFSATLPQRCLVHKQRNVLNAVPKREQQEVSTELAGIWKQEKKEDALLNPAAFKAKYRQRYPEAVPSLCED